MGGTNNPNKMKFLYKILIEDHPTHKCPQMDEIHRYLAHRGAQHILTNTFPYSGRKWL